MALGTSEIDGWTGRTTRFEGYNNNCIGNKKYNRYNVAYRRAVNGCSQCCGSKGGRVRVRNGKNRANIDGKKRAIENIRSVVEHHSQGGGSSEIGNNLYLGNNHIQPPLCRVQVLTCQTRIGNKIGNREKCLCGIPSSGPSGPCRRGIDARARAR